MESACNVWVWLVGEVSRTLVWLVGVGGICGCGCKEVYVTVHAKTLHKWAKMISRYRL